MTRPTQSGAALLLVLLLVAVLAALVVVILDDVRFAQRRAANAETQAQAQWYARGAEVFARLQLERLGPPTRTRLALPPGVAGQPIVFPIEDGIVQATLHDQSPCFNLNSLVEGAGDVLVRRERGVAQFVALLEGLGASRDEARRVADALADWLDADSIAGAFGAEDGAYRQGGMPRFRTGATLLAEPSELRAIRHVTAALYARLRPEVCALPTPSPAPLNLDALAPDDALHLVALTEGRIGLDAARRAIAARPPGGWPDVATFWSQPALAEALPDDTVLQQSTLRSRYFLLRTDVAYLGAEVTTTSLLELDADGTARTLARRWTPEE